MSLFLGLESSCDETAAAVVADGTDVLSSVVRTQVELHAVYGGVVPEIASRCHVEAIGPVAREAMQRAGVAWSDLDGIAATYGPGLASSLVVGLSAAKGLALALDKKLYGVNHIEAHLFSVFLGRTLADYHAAFPLLGLVVSGGHTCWVEMPAPHQYRVIGQTLDDAAGEAFDKAAKLLGLGYPGGPVLEKVGRTATGWDDITFPRGRIQAGNRLLGGLDPELCVSFSGLKTALMYRLKERPALDDAETARLAAAYQEAIVRVLADRCATALKRGKWKGLVVGGGVSLNGRLREALREVCDDANVILHLAEAKYCGDNAAMIAGLASAGGGFCHDADKVGGASSSPPKSPPSDLGLSLDVVPNLRLGSRSAT